MQNQSIAAPGTIDDGAAGDIIVTATRHDTSLQRAPLAISAVTGATLTERGITDSAALSRVSPGLVIRENVISGSRITIRNIQASGEPTVGIYYDETPLVNSAGVNADAGGTTPNIRLYDVERVEVLRGPQGTLFGSSSMAGAVRLIFAKPDLENLGGSFAGQFSTVAGGGAGFQNQAMVNIPLVQGVVGLRAVGFLQEQPSYIDNIVLGRNDINTGHSYGGRLLLRVQPAANLTIDGLAAIQNFDGQLGTYFLAAGAYNANFRALQPVHDRNEIYSGTVKWDIGRVTATVVYSHFYRNFVYSYDTSQYFINNAANYPIGSALSNLFLSQAPSVGNSPQTTKSDTVEARLGSSGDAPFQWTAGFFYSNRQGDIQSNVVKVNSGNGAPLPINSATLFGQRLVYDALRQVAGYAEATYHLTSKLSATGGIRYYKYDRSFSGRTSVLDALVGFTPYPYTVFKTSENGLLYKANLSYQFDRDFMIYGTASSGERPGGVNSALGLPINLQSYKSDQVWNYELGAKAQFLDRAITLNGAVFQMNWTDMQTSGRLPESNFLFIANAGRTRVRGVEIEAAVVPYAGLQFDGSASYIDARLTEDQTNQGLVAAGLKGDAIPLVPTTTAQGGGQYEWALTSNLMAKTRADVSYQGASWTQFRHLNAYQQRLPAYATLDLRAGIEGVNSKWSLALFANNVINNKAVVIKAQNPIYGGDTWIRAISLVPRTIGVDFTKRF